jgi:hypothetical protein
MSDRKARRVVDGKEVPAIQFDEVWREGAFNCLGCGCNPHGNHVFRMRIKFGNAGGSERFFLCGDCMTEVAEKMLELVKTGGK